MVRVKRDGDLEGLGKISKCQVGQQDEKSVPSGTECGVNFEGKTKIEIGDILEVYTEEKVVKKLTVQE